MKKRHEYHLVYEDHRYHWEVRKLIGLTWLGAPIYSVWLLMISDDDDVFKHFQWEKDARAWGLQQIHKRAKGKRLHHTDMGYNSKIKATIKHR